MNLTDQGLFVCTAFNPCHPIPPVPRFFFLIEHIQRLIAKFSELRPPTRTTFDRTIVQNFSDDKNLLPVVNLVPDALQNFAEGWTVCIASMHQARDVFQAYISILPQNSAAYRGASSPAKLLSKSRSSRLTLLSMGVCSLRRTTTNPVRCKRCN